VQHAYAAGERGVPAKFSPIFSPSGEGVRGWWTLISKWRWFLWLYVPFKGGAFFSVSVTKKTRDVIIHEAISK
jgi:hypothetical protein